MSPEFSPTIDWLSHIDEYAYSPYQACQAVNDILYKSTVYANQIFHKFRHPLIARNAKDWNCVQYVYGVQYVMRDLGVPVHIDYTPQYGVRETGTIGIVYCTIQDILILFKDIIPVPNAP